jgi:hypothetical protein
MYIAISRFDAITTCNFFIEGFQNKVRSAINNWQLGWDAEQDKYEFGDELTADEKEVLVRHHHESLNLEIAIYM